MPLSSLFSPMRKRRWLRMSWPKSRPHLMYLLLPRCGKRPRSGLPNRCTTIISRATRSKVTASSSLRRRWRSCARSSLICSLDAGAPTALTMRRAVSVRSLQNASPHLIQFDGLEQGLEVALSETVVTLALNNFKKNRTDLVFGKDLQQQPAVGGAIKQNPVFSQALHIFSVARQTAVQ